MSNKYGTITVTVTDEGVEIWNNSVPKRWVVVPEQTWKQIVADWGDEEIKHYRRALVAHHALHTLSDEVIAEYDFRECPVCKRARES